ncbi:hypothetical protein [Marihabitans asiaticum]|nr:hypothetical protein [Marihabitans asiaticum]
MSKNHKPVQWSLRRWLRRRETLALRYLDMRAHNQMGLQPVHQSLRRTELKIGSMWPDLYDDFVERWAEFDNAHRHQPRDFREGCIYCLLDKVRRQSPSLNAA